MASTTLRRSAAVGALRRRWQSSSSERQALAFHDRQQTGFQQVQFVLPQCNAALAVDVILQEGVIAGSEFGGGR